MQKAKTKQEIANEEYGIHQNTFPTCPKGADIQFPKQLIPTKR